jgi:hypothetical protein
LDEIAKQVNRFEAAPAIKSVIPIDSLRQRNWHETRCRTNSTAVVDALNARISIGED